MKVEDVSDLAIFEIDAVNLLRKLPSQPNTHTVARSNCRTSRSNVST
jgi:hypothetical protein